MELLSVGPPGLDSSGYGEMQRRILLSLEDLGWKVTLRPFPSLNAPIDDPVSEKRLAKMEKRPLPPAGSPMIFFGPAPMFRPNPNYYNVGFTMTEVDHITQEWVDKCNSMDEVWVPSRFNYHIFLDQGVRPEVLRIMHLGVDTQHFKPARNVCPGDKFRFLASFELIPRKACDILIEAFCEEFLPHEPVELIIKAFENGGRYDPQGRNLDQLHRKIVSKFSVTPAITLKKEILPYSAMADLYRSADCFISTSRGEGWNLPAMEAMACGIPAIALKWSGHMEFLTPLNSFLVEVSGLEKINAPWCPEGRWAILDKGALRRVMRHVSDHPLEVKQKGIKARIDVKKNHSIRLIAEKISSRLTRRVAVVGFGSWGKNIVRVLLSLPSVKVSICDPALKTHPFPGDSRVSLCSFNEILKNQLISEVFIVTPASTHYSLAREALVAGKNVFVEKPFTMTTAEAEKLRAVSRANNLTLMVGHIMHYHPAVHHLKAAIDRGALGKILYFRSTRTNLGTVRADVGVIRDLAVHDIDMISFLSGQLPLSVSSWSGIFLEHSPGDMASIQMTFPSGAMAHLFVSWLDPLRKRELVVVGDKKMALFNDTSPSQKLAIIDRGVEYVKDIDFKNYGEFQFHYRHGDIVYPYISMEEPLRNEIIHFLECAENRTEPRTGPDKAVMVTKIIEAADLSARGGGSPIQIEWDQKGE